MRATEKGAAEFRRIAMTHGASIAARMATLTDAELSQLRDLTAKLRRPIDDDC